MQVDQIKKILLSEGIELKEETAINHGTSLKFLNGSIINVFDTGKFSVQGKEQDKVKALLVDKADINNLIQSNKKVFVVYGHDLALRSQLEAMLRRWNLEPQILDQMPSEGQTIIEKLENYTNEVHFAVVLATPDDEGYKAGHQDEKAFRARQNVVLELGMLLSKLGRKKVAIILKQQENMERPSDIQGLIYIPFKDNLEKDAGLLLAKEMHAQGYQIDVGKI